MISFARWFLRLLVRFRMHQAFLVCELLLAVWILRHGRPMFTVVIGPGKPWWDPYPWQAIAPFAVGLVALATLYTNKRQQDNHFGLKSINDEFRDVLDRFADTDNPTMRANAAMRLAELAERCAPGGTRGTTRSSHPFFPRAASQLAAATLLEPDPTVRHEATKALFRMVEFAKRGDQDLLYALFREMADVNRSAKVTLARALADHRRIVGELNEERINRLAHFAPVCSDVATTVLALGDLAQSRECLDAFEVSTALEMADGTSEGTIDERRSLTLIGAAAERLLSTVGILRQCIAVHRRSPGQYLDFVNWYLVGTAPSVDLSSCFLAGIEIDGARMQDFDLRDCYLEGAALFRAELQRAWLYKAKLGKVHLISARLSGARMSAAIFRDANLGGAKIDRADLAGADLRGAKVGGADFSEVGLSGALVFGMDTGSGRWRKADADFSACEWRRATFEDPDSNEVDSALFERLEERFPTVKEARKGPGARWISRQYQKLFEDIMNRAAATPESAARNASTDSASVTSTAPETDPAPGETPND